MKAKSLESLIKEKYGCDSEHVRSEAVHELSLGMTAWQGTVEVFKLIDYPQAKHAYVWQYEEGRQTKTHVALEIPPVDSPQAVVKVARAAKARRDHRK